MKSLLKYTPARHTLGLALLTALSGPNWAQSADPATSAATPDSLPRVEVSGRHASGLLRSPSAIGLELSWKETPQALTVLGEQQLRDYQLFSVGDALAAVPGLYVDRFETDRSSYFARGFAINNFQIDGLGLLPGAFTGLEDKGDTALYERIEVLRGAGSLLVGAGNPSATVNYVRKRPLGQPRSLLNLSLGSWGLRRAEADLSQPLNQDGSWRGRLVLMKQSKDSYLDRYHVDSDAVYGVVEAELSERTLLTVGLSQQQREARGAMWGAVPLVDKAGKALSFARHVSSAPDWSRWDVRQTEAFVDVAHHFASGWQARAVALHMKHRGRAQLLWWADTPEADGSTGGTAWPSRYDPDRNEHSLDLRVSGPLALGGRQHELVAGVQVGRSHLVERSLVGDSLGVALPPLGQWQGQMPLPVFNGAVSGSNLTDQLRSAYAALRLRPTDTVQLMLGANHTRVSTQGDSYDTPKTASAQRTLPYAGLVWALSPQWSSYVSHTALFRPQGELDANLQRLAPVRGSNAEWGLKGQSQDGRLSAALAAFNTQQINLATYQGQHPVQSAVAVYRGVDTRSRGVELEARAQVLPELSVNAAYTQLKLTDASGASARLDTPRKTAQVGATWQLSPAMRMGAQWAWRSAVYSETGREQGAYGLLDLMASYALQRNLQLSLNLRNASNVDVLHFSGASQGYHWAPRSLQLALNWKV